MHQEFQRLAALAATTLRLRIDYLPRSSELLCSVARTGYGRRDLDLHLALVADDSPEVASALLTAWHANYLFGAPETAAEACKRVLAGCERMRAPGEQEASRLAGLTGV